MQNWPDLPYPSWLDQVGFALLLAGVALLGIFVVSTILGEVLRRRRLEIEAHDRWMRSRHA